MWPSNEAFFNKMRHEGAFIAVAVDPLTSHECGNQRYLAVPWFDACLAARLPEKSGDPLRPMPEHDAWIAPLQVGQREILAPVPAGKFAGDLATSIWLPNEAVARAWKQYVTDTGVVDTTPPPAPTNLQLTGNELTWEADADLESGISHFIILQDGQSLASVPDMPKNPFGRPVFQGLQYSDTPAAPLAQMRYTIETAEPGLASHYHIRAVNTVGLMSE